VQAVVEAPRDRGGGGGRLRHRFASAPSAPPPPPRGVITVAATAHGFRVFAVRRLITGTELL